MVNRQDSNIEAYAIIGNDVKLELDKDFKNFALDISNKIKDADRSPKLVSIYVKQCLDLFVPTFGSEDIGSLIESLTVISNKKKKEENDKNKKEIKVKNDDFGDSVPNNKTNPKYVNDDDFM